MENTNSEIQPVNKPETNNEPVYNRTNFSTKIIIALAVLIVIFIGSSIFLIFLNRNNDKDLSRENERLIRLNPDLSEGEIDELEAKRSKVQSYAENNNITVSQDEIEQEKRRIIDLNGEESVNQDLTSKRWSQNDWTEIIRWQILRSKILSSLEAYRIGELYMIRWDGTVQNIDEAIALERRPAAEDYLESVREELEAKNISNLKEAQSTLNLETNTFFENSTYEYQVQYLGIDSIGSISSNDPKINGFYKFDINENVANAQILSGLNVPAVSEVICDLRSCSLYNIVDGSDGARTDEEEEVLKILQFELPI